MRSSLCIKHATGGGCDWGRGGGRGRSGVCRYGTWRVTCRHGGAMNERGSEREQAHHTLAHTRKALHRSEEQHPTSAPHLPSAKCGFFKTFSRKTNKVSKKHSAYHFGNAWRRIIFIVMEEDQHHRQGSNNYAITTPLFKMKHQPIFLVDEEKRD